MPYVQEVFPKLKELSSDDLVNTLPKIWLGERGQFDGMCVAISTKKDACVGKVCGRPRADTPIAEIFPLCTGCFNPVLGIRLLQVTDKLMYTNERVLNEEDRAKIVDYQLKHAENSPKCKALRRDWKKFLAFVNDTAEQESEEEPKNEKRYALSDEQLERLKRLKGVE